MSIQPAPLHNAFNEGCELYYVHDEDWNHYKMYVGDFDDDELIFSGKVIKALYLHLLKEFEIENPNEHNVTGNINRGIIDKAFADIVKYMEDE